MEQVACLQTDALAAAACEWTSQHNNLPSWCLERLLCCCLHKAAVLPCCSQQLCLNCSNKGRPCPTFKDRKNSCICVLMLSLCSKLSSPVAVGLQEDHQVEEFQIASELFKAHANQLFDFMAEKLSDCIGRFGNRSASTCPQA